MHKRVALFVVFVVAAAGIAVAASTNADSARQRATAAAPLVGFYDDEQVYGRTDEPCRDCATPLERLVVAGRSSHFCPRCQPL